MHLTSLINYHNLVYFISGLKVVYLWKTKT